MVNLFESGSGRSVVAAARIALDGSFRQRASQLKRSTRMRGWSSYVLGAVVVSWIAVASVAAQNPGGSPEARKVKNPVAPTAASIKAGEQLYMKNCQFCHGPTGLGDGKLVPKDMKPANLADDKWDRGSTDGEIHAVILGGIPDKKMPGVKGRLSDADTWNIVNYLRSIGPKTAAR